MNIDWIKTPKNKQEEKEQFDKLYHLLVRMSGSPSPSPSPSVPVPSVPVPSVPVPSARVAPVPSTPFDEFTRMKVDLLANLRMSGGAAIPPLETCRGCDRSFYSQEELNKHFVHAPACQEWVRRGLLRVPSMDVPFFSLLEEGLHTLVVPGGKTCRFCEKPLANRKALERHLQASGLCNRLAHDTFRTWYGSLPVASPAQPVLALPAPAEQRASGW